MTVPEKRRSVDSKSWRSRDRVVLKRVDLSTNEALTFSRVGASQVFCIDARGCRTADLVGAVLDFVPEAKALKIEQVTFDATDDHLSEIEARALRGDRATLIVACPPYYVFGTGSPKGGLPIQDYRIIRGLALDLARAILPADAGRHEIYRGPNTFHIRRDPDLPRGCVHIEITGPRFNEDLDGAYGPNAFGRSFLSERLAEVGYAMVSVSNTELDQARRKLFAPPAEGCLLTVLARKGESALAWVSFLSEQLHEEVELVAKLSASRESDPHHDFVRGQVGGAE